MPTYEEPVKTGAADGAVAAMRASFNSKDVGSMASEAKKMLDSARSGGFTVSEEAAQPIIDVLNEIKDRVERLSHDLMLVTTQEPPLGDHDYGKKVADHQYEAFCGDDGSAVSVLRQLYNVLEDSSAALDVARKKYQESEAGAASTFGEQI